MYIVSQLKLNLVAFLGKEKKKGFFFFLLNYFCQGTREK